MEDHRKRTVKSHMRGGSRTHINNAVGGSNTTTAAGTAAAAVGDGLTGGTTTTKFKKSRSSESLISRRSQVRLAPLKQVRSHARISGLKRASSGVGFAHLESTHESKQKASHHSENKKPAPKFDLQDNDENDDGYEDTSSSDEVTVDDEVPEKASEEASEKAPAQENLENMHTSTAGELPESSTEEVEVVEETQLRQPDEVASGVVSQSTYKATEEATEKATEKFTEILPTIEQFPTPKDLEPALKPPFRGSSPVPPQISTEMVVTMSMPDKDAIKNEVTRSNSQDTIADHEELNSQAEAGPGLHNHQNGLSANRHDTLSVNGSQSLASSTSSTSTTRSGGQMSRTQQKLWLQKQQAESDRFEDHISDLDDNSSSRDFRKRAALNGHNQVTSNMMSVASWASSDQLLQPSLDQRRELDRISKELTVIKKYSNPVVHSIERIRSVRKGITVPKLVPPKRTSNYSLVHQGSVEELSQSLTKRQSALTATSINRVLDPKSAAPSIGHVNQHQDPTSMILSKMWTEGWVDPQDQTETDDDTKAKIQSQGSAINQQAHIAQQHMASSQKLQRQAGAPIRLG